MVKRTKVAAAKSIKTLRDVIPQRENANRHTQTGLGMLEDSIGRDGFLGAITVAANGECFDGSARVEVGGPKFETAQVVRTHGEPVIVIREDIPNADCEQARRASVAANAIAAVDLDFDSGLLNLWQDGDDALARMLQEAGHPEWLESIPNVEFPEKTEAVANEVKYHECPECGHKFPA